MSVRAGERLGPYDSFASIGTGGMDDVYPAVRATRNITLERTTE
jgi:hypothetical protein